MAVNDELAALFEQMAQISQLRGENVFKSVTFSRVARTLESLPFDIREQVESGTLGEVEGVGEHSRRIIEEYVRTGHCIEFGQMLASIPAGLLDLLRIPGMGPKTVALLWKEKQITSVGELRQAIDGGKLEGLKGIGEKKIQAMREGLQTLQAGQERRGLPEAQAAAAQLLDALRAVPGTKQLEIAGSVRRRRETIGDVDLLCTVGNPEDAAGVCTAFSRLPQVEKVISCGGTKASVLVAHGLQVDLRVVPDESFGAAMLYFTGSKAHNVKVRGRAQEKGLTLNEWGLYDAARFEAAARKAGEKPPLPSVAGRTEAEVYAALGLAYVEPELREDRGEVEAAAAHKLPHLLTQQDIHGDLHCHTKASDGHGSIEEMVEAALARGYQYLAITDHSQSSVIANGLDARRLKAHIKAIRAAAGHYKDFTLLAGAEVDILVDGRLDYDDALLAELDLVIASPHASLRQDREKGTERLLRAIEHRHVNIIGHPTGRLISRRTGLDLDLQRLFKAAAAANVAMEINAGWPRLDLNDINARAAAQSGVKLAINTDAHAPSGFGDMSFGVAVARRAWLGKHEVINAWSTAELLAFLRKG